MKKRLVILGIILLYCLICEYLLDSHYVWDNESCAAILYYQPLSIADRLLFLFLGSLFSAILWYIGKCKGLISQIMTILFIAFCILTAAILGFWGNDILGSRTEYWPHEYKVQPLN